MELTDTVLLEKWQTQRDPDAFSELVHRHWSMVFGCCRRVLGDAGQAEDVAQECFVELMHARGHVRVSLVGWLHTMSVRRCLDRIKSESRRRAREKTFVRATGKSASDQNPELDEIVAKVDEAIEQLSKGARAVLVARFFEGLSYGEIARRLGASESGARAKVTGAIEEVRCSLKRLGVIAGGGAILAVLEAPATPVPASILARLAKISMAAPMPAIGIAALLMAGAGAKVAIVAAAIALTAAATWITSTRPDTTATAKRPEVVMKATDSPQPPAAVPQNVQPSQDLTPQADVTADGQQPAAPQPSISGRVYDAATGEGIEGAALAISNALTGILPTPDLTTATDGSYHVENLPDGDYRVSVSAEQYPADSDTALIVRAPATDVDFALNKGTPFSGIVVDTEANPVQGAEIVAETRARTTTWSTKSGPDGRFVLYTTPGVSEISIQARSNSACSQVCSFAAATENLQLVLNQPRTAGVSGFVVDSSGTPLPGATIRLYRLTPQLFMFEGPAQTDEAGRFAITDCGAGQYAVIVVPAGHSETWSTNEEYARVALEAGQQVENLEVVYGPRDGLTISGHVVDATGEPVPNVQVNIYEENILPASTDSAGAFSVSGLGDREYTVYFDHEHYSGTHATLSAGTLDAVVQIQARGALDATVVYADSGAPVTQFKYNYVSGKTDAMNSMLYDLSKDVRNDNGLFHIENVNVGDGTLAVWANGLAPQVLTFCAEPGKLTSLNFELHSARSVNGIVTNEKGGLLADAVLYFGDHVSYDTLERSAVARTDQTGAFVINSIPTQAKFVFAYHSGYGLGRAPVGENMKIILPASASVTGTVSLAGLAPKDLSINVLYPDEPSYPQYQVKPDEQGHFRFVNLTPGLLRVFVLYPNRSGVERQIQLTAGGAASFDFPVPQGTASAMGRVSKDGEPVTDAQVDLKKEIEGFTFFAITDVNQEGTFRLDQVWTGPTELVVGRYDHINAQTLSDTFDVEISEEGIPLEIELP